MVKIFAEEGCDLNVQNDVSFNSIILSNLKVDVTAEKEYTADDCLQKESH